MVIGTSRIGVPYLIDEDGLIVPLTHVFTGDVIAAEMMEPGIIDALTRRIRLSIEEMTGIDPDMNDVQWWATFNNLLAINEFTTPLHVLSQARMGIENQRHE